MTTLDEALAEIRGREWHAQGIALDEVVARWYRTDVPLLLAALDAVMAECENLERSATANRVDAEALDAKGQGSLWVWATYRQQHSTARQLRQAITTALKGGVE